MVVLCNYVEPQLCLFIDDISLSQLKLSISDVEGGFDSNETKFEFEDENSVVILPEWKVLPLPDDKLPGMVRY